MKKITHHTGFTLIEMIIYIALVALISTSLVGLYIQIIKLQSSAQSAQEVNESLRLVSSKLNYEIRQASGINSVSPILSLSSIEVGRDPTVFELQNGRIKMTVGTSSSFITSNLVTIDNFTLQNLSSGDSSTQNIRYTISGSYKDSNMSISGSAEVRAK